MFEFDFIEMSRIVSGHLDNVYTTVLHIMLYKYGNLERERVAAVYSRKNVEHINYCLRL